jgi:hypothetical protein
MRKQISIVALALTSACASVPPVTVSTEHGLVRASTGEQVVRVAEALAAAPRVRDTLHSIRIDLPELWVVEHDRSAIGSYNGSRIELKPQAGDYHVLHELVHWYVHGSPFDGMPQFLEEGLCDFVALQVLGLVSARQREHVAIGELTVSFDSLSMRARRFLGLSVQTRIDLTRVGFEVVSRLGLDRLQVLAAAQADPWSYLREAGLVSDSGPTNTGKCVNPDYQGGLGTGRVNVYAACVGALEP